MGTANRHPLSVPATSTFARLFPRTALTLETVAAIVKAAGWLLRTGWVYRVELTGVVVAGWLWRRLADLLNDPAAAARMLLVTAAVAGAVLAIPPAPAGLAELLGRSRACRWLLVLFGVRARLGAVLARHWWGRPVLWAAGALMRARTRRLLHAGLRELRLANTSGKLPQIAWVWSTAVGERVLLWCRAGQSAELLDTRIEEVRAAVKARDVRLERDPGKSHRVFVDVVRRDPLAATAKVPWQGATAGQVSMWDPIHFAIGEDGRPVYLELPYRQLLLGGAQDSGKSTGGRTVIAHAAKSYDGHLLLIDPNRVQYSPWADRALAFATNDPDDAIDVLRLAQAEIDRRSEILDGLSRTEEKITRELAEEYDLPVWLVSVEELAYFTSVVGSAAQRAAFSTIFRDVTARGRFVLVVPMTLTQRPTSDIVPTSLRDLFSIRVAYRCNTPDSSDVILGDNWARQGYSAADIPLGASGVGWLHSTGGRPRRIKSVHVPLSLVDELRTSTLANRPAVPAELAALMPAPADEGAER